MVTRGRRIRGVALAVAMAMAAAALALVAPDEASAQDALVEPSAEAAGYTGGGQGYLLDDGRFRRIAFPGATGTLPWGINNRGQIVGVYDDARGRTHGFLWEGGRYRTFDAPMGTGTTPEGVSGSAAFGINDRGQIVGAYVDGDGRVHGYLWQRGRFRTLDAPGATSTLAFGINDRGQVTLQATVADGPLHFLLDEGEFTPVRFPGAVFTGVHKVSRRGQVVGSYYDRDGVQHGFTLNRGRYRTVDFPGATATGLNASNGRGQIVGYHITGDATDPTAPTRGALLDRGRLRLFDAPGPPRGRAATTAYDINDRGQIVGARVPLPER